MGSACAPVSAVCSNQPDIDEKEFRHHLTSRLLSSPSSLSDNNLLHSHVIQRNESALKKALKQSKNNSDILNGLDHHGYSALHLAVLMKWEKGVDMLLSYYGSPLVVSQCGWTAIDEAISTSQFKIAKKLVFAVSQHFEQYSKQNVRKLYASLTQKNDFYIEINLETSARGLSGVAGQYLPCDVLKIWKKKENVRLDMALIDYDEEQKQWIKGDVSYVFKVNHRSGLIDYHRIDRQTPKKEFFPQQPLLLNLDDVGLDILNPAVMNNERLLRKWLMEPVKSRQCRIDKSKFKRQKSWISGKGEQVNIDGIACSVYKVSGIEFVSKYRNEHIPKHKRKHIQNESNILSLMHDDDDDDDDAERGMNVMDQDDDDDLKESEDRYEPPHVLVHEYKQSEKGDRRIRQSSKHQSYDEDETFVINAVETNISRTSYNLTVCMTDATAFGITVNEILSLFDLFSLQTTLINNIKPILQLTAFDEQHRFPLRLEMPFFLNLVKATVTFQNFKRETVNSNVFKIPK